MKSLGILAVAAFGLSAGPVLHANAQTASPAQKLQAGTQVTQVQYAGTSDRRRYAEEDYDDNDDALDVPGEVVGGVARGLGGIVGMGTGSEGAAECARRFRSFDPSTGTYTTYSGEQVMCPYLRG